MMKCNTKSPYQKQLHNFPKTFSKALYMHPLPKYQNFSWQASSFMSCRE